MTPEQLWALKDALDLCENLVVRIRSGLDTRSEKHWQSVVQKLTTAIAEAELPSVSVECECERLFYEMDREESNELLLIRYDDESPAAVRAKALFHEQAEAIINAPIGTRFRLTLTALGDE
jgi:hypothetical protein